MPGFLSPLHQRPPRSLRWAVLVIASLLLHVVVYQWANGYLVLPAANDKQPAVIVTELLAPPAPAPAPAVAVPKRKPRPPHAPSPAQASASIVELPPPAMETPAPAEPETAAAGTTAETAPADATADLAYPIDPPPSAQLQYDVQALREGQTWHGNGMLHWQVADNRYSVIG